MLCCLSRGNFAKKCKKGVNCINSRIVIIKNKKNAMLRWLRKDVADLLANGHDTKAFGRIQELIVEMNLASCYDMIEQYCECILQQLPSLQKKRECSEKAMEAMSTLVFAAARFSDLPELCDLRHVFTERYGSRMKSSINREFVEKAQKKSFSMDKKLQVMQGISEEFCVSWDSKAFQQKNSSRTAAPCSDQTKGQFGLISLEKPSVGPVVSRDAKDVNLIPLYTKSKGGRNETNIKVCLPAYDELPHAEKGLDSIAEERLHPKTPNSNNATLVSLNAASTVSDDVKITSMPLSSDMPNRDERPKPFSVRTKHPKPPLAENKDVLDDAKPTIQTSSSRRYEGRQIGDYNGGTKVMYRHVRRASAEELGSATYSSGCDEEEEAMDRLLVYYSRKGMNNESSETRTMMRAPTELALNADRDRSHHNGNGRVYPELGEPVHRRIASLPSEPTTHIPSAVASPNGGLLHPKLPDYDELASRINALRKT